MHQGTEALATAEVFTDAEWPLAADDGDLDEHMLAVLVAAEQFPSESEGVEEGLAEAYALRQTPVAEQRALRAYASSSNAVAPVLSLPTQTCGSRRAPRELRAA